ncbi:MAG TPA: phosphatidate cytidylyltransferase [Anaeromyxobacter sp.]|nr:phosphatidate cytidylyltransferase [Anaeromyxobacter sp.]
MLEPGNRRNLALRVASAVVLLPLALWITWMGGLPFALLAAAAAAVAAAELVMMFGTAGVGEVVAVAVAGALPLSAALGPGPGLFPAYTAPGLALALVLLLAAFLFRRAPIESIPPRAATAALSWLYCGLLVSTAVGLRRIGLAWILLAFVVTWGNDTLAYFAGHALGRHRMMERISPRKTWEGFAGGAVGSVAGALMCRYFLPELRAVTAGGMALLGAGAAVLGPLGDLCESLLKRAAGVKDSGRIIPGHGGLLDRIDALLFVAPWVYLWAAAAAR